MYKNKFNINISYIYILILILMVLVLSSCNSTASSRKEEDKIKDSTQFTETTKLLSTTSTRYIDKLASNFYEKAQLAQTDKTIAATVNGEPVYKAVIERNKSLDEITYFNSKKEIEESNGLTELQKKDYLKELENSHNQTDKQRIDTIIRNMIMIQEAQKKGFQANEEEAYQKAKQNYELMKESSGKTDDLIYNIVVKDYIKTMGWSEEDYIQISAITFKEGILVQKLLDDFGAESIDDSDFKAYVDDLIKKADIHYCR